MGKINLAKQNQYVEFAQKDDEGNIISQALKTIVEAIEGKVVFNGSVAVEMISGDKGVKKANLPTTTGVYKLSSGGVLCITVNSASSISLIATYGDSMYTETRDPASTADFKFIEDNRMGDKPIYWHGLDLFKSGSNLFECHILNNSPTPIGITGLKDWFESIEGGVRLSGSGCCVFDNVVYAMTHIYKASNNTYSIYFIDTANNRYNSTQLMSWDDLLTYFSNCNDVVNRVN